MYKLRWGASLPLYHPSPSALDSFCLPLTLNSDKVKFLCRGNKVGIFLDCTSFGISSSFLKLAEWDLKESQDEEFFSSKSKVCNASPHASVLNPGSVLWNSLKNVSPVSMSTNPRTTLKLSNLRD